VQIKGHCSQKNGQTFWRGDESENKLYPPAKKDIDLGENRAEKKRRFGGSVRGEKGVDPWGEVTNRMNFRGRGGGQPKK